MSGLRNFKKKLNKTLLTLIVLVFAVIFVFPIVLTVTNSFMSQAEINRNYSTYSVDEKDGDEFFQLRFIPDEVVLKQYYTVLVKRTKFLYMFWNSVFLVVPMIIGQVVVSSMAAYAFGKINFRCREPLFFVYIITMMMPFQVTLVPNYIIAEKLCLIGSPAAIILPGIFSTFGVFLLRQFMVYIPNEYCEAARIDGCGHAGIFLRVILPMCKTGIAALVILAFMDNWNMVEQPIIFLQDMDKMPLSIYLSVINEGERGVAFAASTIYMIPMILIFLYGENYLVEGIQLSGIKA